MTYSARDAYATVRRAAIQILDGSVNLVKNAYYDLRHPLIGRIDPEVQASILNRANRRTPSDLELLTEKKGMK